MTVGFFSPLPPARTGVADYSAALLAALRAYGDIRVNARDADARLYHLGNNQLHRAIYDEALACPGVAVLHDAALNHFFLGRLGRAAYIDEFVYNYGDWNRALAEELWDGRARSAQDPRYFRYAMVRRIAETSLAVVVHNPGAAAIVQAHAPAAAAYEIPHLFSPPALPAAAEVERWRADHGVAPGRFLFGVFGHLRESKRLESILCAFENVRGAALLVAGDFDSPDLARAIGPRLEQPGIVRAPYVPEEEFWLMASAVDACISLRYPAAGETSGIAVRLMGIGKPVLLTAGPETSRLPESACVRIDPGVAEPQMLAEYMGWLAACREDARAIGRRAAAHISAQHLPSNAARRYWEVLCAHCG